VSSVPGPRPRRAVDGILLLDKPLGLTSNAALQRVKRLFAAEKAGHTGALDPLATGVLPICLGEATKLSAYLLDSDKAYRARVRLGTATTTGDAEGEVIRRSDPSGVSRAELESAGACLVGEIRQVPPMYSALKREGRPLYELARAGIEVPREPRAIRIHALRLIDFAPGEFGFEVRCSKGTYVRTLAEDWAGAVGQAAHLVALRRIAAGPYDESSLWTLEQLERRAADGPASLDQTLLSPASALRAWPQLRVDRRVAEALAHGRPVQFPEAPAQGPLAVLDEGGELLGLAEVDAAGRVAPRRWLRSRQGS
jgi:tRNA pseudouridine55 synthase